jgi:endonuclease/exonuclease/phosphatase family metal-dependent hydrolase
MTWGKQSRVLAAALIILFADATWAFADEVKVASFNIQNLGKTKIKKKPVMKTLASTMREFDIIAVQEVSDISEQAPQALLDKLNESGRHYDILLSPRTGEQPDDKTAQEQYAFYFDTDTVEAKDAGALFDDSANDLFQREPFTAQFGLKGTSFTFTITTIHTQPKQAVPEIDALFEVYEDVKSRYPGEANHMIVGDYNASCTYAKPADLASLKIRGSSFSWIVPDNVDTTVSPTTDCAYDRIVLTKALNKHFSEWGIADWFTSKAVSDHWPVWVTLDSAAQ